MLALVVTLILCVLGLPVLGSVVYLLALTLLSAPLKTPPQSTRRLRFNVIVPAHNEALVISRTLASLARIDWPAANYRCVVVADNCSDDTAALSLAAGARVIERHDTDHRGKGYALERAFADSAQEAWADAIVVVDADSVVTPNLLEAFAARIEQGAHAMQSHYGVLNPLASWRTRLISIAHGAFHVVRSRARERLQLSSGLRGNGWCVTRQLSQAVPFNAVSLTEDLEYGIVLGLAGYRVHYAHEADTDAEMTSNSSVAQSQRERWEQGRMALVREFTLPLLRAAVVRRSGLCLDLAFDLLVLPLSYLTLLTVLLLIAATAAAVWLPALQPLAWIALAGLLALVAHVLRGWQLSSIGLRGIVDLARVPVFIVWKLGLLLRSRAMREWVPTRRDQT